MSTTIDQKVVEMRFDNRHFEANARESMSTLEKLKQKLNLSGASKGLENLNTSANKVNMNGLSSALDTVHSKFSAMEIVGITALANIANSAVNAGKRMVAALTIDPVKDGFNEYEMTLNAIQTTMAGTGKTAKEVEEQLKLLDKYADKTVYSTADMLNNLPKFTNAGVALEDATTAMIGIANATALAGGDAGKASIAFYNLGQAIGTGYLTRMDYNSINNAGIATMEWKNQMVGAAIAAGTLTQVGDDLYQAGNRTFTLQQLFIDGLQEQWATTDVMMSVFKAYGDETTEIGKKAYASAQDIKTFSMMMESLKATAGTGWKDTWQIIFGDLDEAKEFWTGLTNFISGIITGIADFRNYILDSALGRSFGVLLDNVKKPFKEIEKTVNNVKDYAKVVDEIINGKWGNGKKRWDALTEAGYDWKHAQNLVNEELGVSLRRTTDYKETQKEIAKTQAEVDKSTTDYLVSLADLSDAELEAALGSKEQVKAFRELQRVAKQTGIPLKEFIENIDEIDGRWILLNSFKNIGQGLVAVFGAMRDAWVDIFPVDGIADGLFNLIAAFHKFTTYLTVSEEAADKLRRTFKGLFALLDIAFTIVAGPIKLLFKIFLQLLGALDIGFDGVLTFTAGIGDCIVAFHDWLDSVLDFTGIFKFLAPYIKKAASAVKDWFKSLKDSKLVKDIAENLVKAKDAVISFIKSLKDSEKLKKFADYLRKSKDAIVDWFKGIKETDNIPKYIIQGLINGLKTGISDVVGVMFELGGKLIEAIKKVLGIHSPSTEFYEIGKNIVQGLFNGISDFVKMVYTLIMSIGTKLTDIVTSLDLGSIFTIAIGSGSVYGFIKFTQAIDRLTSPLESLDDLLDQAKKTLKAFGGVLKSLQLKIIAESVKTLAVAIAILAGSIVVLTLVDQKKMWSAVGAIVVLAGVLAGLTAIAGKFGGKEGVQFGKLALTLLALGFSMTLMAKALNTIAKIKPEQALQAIGGFIVLMGSLIGLMAVVNKNKSGFLKLGTSFLGIASALLVMAMVTKILGKMKQEELIQGGLAIIAFSGIIVGLMAATRLLTGSKNVDKIANTIAKVGTAILMMGIVAKILGKMKREELIQGGLAIIAFSGIIVGLMAATKLISGSTNVAKIGGAIVGIAGSILMMALVTKMLCKMEQEDIEKGIAAIAAFSGIIVGLMAATKLISGSKNVSKIGKTLLMISVSIGLMAISAALLSLIDIEGLKKGITAVGFLSAFMAGLIFVTKYAKNVKGTMIAITVAIGILALSVGLLAMIDPTKLAGATIAIGIVLGMFALVIYSTGAITKAMGTLIVLTVAIGLLAGALYLIAQLPIEQSLGAAAALSILLLTLSAALVIASLLGPTAMQGVGALALLTLVVAGLAGIIALMNNLKMDSAMTSAKALSTLLLGMSAALVILSIVGLMGPAAFIGVAALATLIVGLTAVVVAIGALMEQFPALQSFLDTGISTLIQLANGIGKAIGAFVSGVLTQISSGLPEVATNLSLFMKNLTPFIEGAKMIDGNVLAGVGILAAAIIALTAASLIEGITSFLPFVGSFAQLGTELSNFMKNALPFITTAMLIKPEIIESIKTLAETLLILTGANLLEGINRLLGGESSLETFATQLPLLGTGIKAFINSLGTISEDQVVTAQNAANIIKTLAKAASEIPNTGGLLGDLVGNNDMGPWAEQLPIMAKGIVDFINILAEADISSASIEIAKSAAEIIKTLATAAEEIPNTGGLLAELIGDNPLDKFADGLPKVGKGIVGFVNSLLKGEITEKSVGIAKTAAEVIGVMADVATKIPNTGGVLAKMFGDDDLGNFAKKLPDVGTGIAGFAEKLGTFGDDKLSTVKAATNAIKAIADLGKLDLESTGNRFKAFGTKLKEFASPVKTFVTDVGSIGKESIDAAVSNINNLVDMVKNIAKSEGGSLKSFAESLKSIATEGVNGFINAFTGTTTITKANTAGSTLVNNVKAGANSAKEALKTACNTIAKEAVLVMCNQTLKDSARQAGVDLATGFANGIKSQDSIDKVAGAGTAIGKAALKAAKEAIKSNSPSKEAMKIGNYFGQGLVIGIQEYEAKSYDAGYGIADNAKDGLSRAISKVSNIISSGIDAQPTIRPVLDLSDVESGAGYLNTMFNDGPSIGVMSNLRAISSGMNTRSQNGSNGEVVSAINKLRKDLGNINGTTNNYNVNGITYDDGSNITDAVRTLVRAAKVERRV